MMRLWPVMPFIGLVIACASAVPVTQAAAAANAGGCIADIECDDDNPCTADVCLDSECLNVPIENGLPCSDRAFCNGQETCQVGVCTAGTPPCVDAEHCDEEADTCLACIDDLECDDGNPCTYNVCTPAGCVNPARANGTPCPDGIFCNGAETCFGGVCVDGQEPCIDRLHCDEAGQACLAEVNLVWRPALHFVGVEQQFEVGLYVVPDDLATDASISAVQANLNWNPELLEFGGIINQDPDLWLFSGLPSGPQGCGANATFSDGDAYYRSLSNFPPDIPVATPEGLLVATFLFRARVETLAAAIDIVDSNDPLCETLVVSGAVPGLDILNNAGGIRVRASDPAVQPGDGNGDGLVDRDDFALFLACVSGPGGGLPAGCEPFDLDIDLDVDFVDFGWFQRLFAGP